MKKLIIAIALAMVAGLIMYSPPASAQSSTNLPWELEHKVRPGEHLHMLAGFYYRDAKKWEMIYQSNMNIIENPKWIYPGQVLTIRLPKDWEPPMSYEVWYEKFATSGTGPSGLKVQKSIVADDKKSEEDSGS